MKVAICVELLEGNVQVKNYRYSLERRGVRKERKRERMKS
jgi:hypothetical protein